MESAAETESSRNRRYFRLEPEGLDRLRKAREVLTRFWDGIEGVLESGGERV